MKLDKTFGTNSEFRGIPEIKKIMVSDKKFRSARTPDQLEALGYFWFQGSAGLERLTAAKNSGAIKRAVSLTIMEIPKTDLSWIGMLSNLSQVYLAQVVQFQ
jgi:hypothetical protein